MSQVTYPISLVNQNKREMKITESIVIWIWMSICNTWLFFPPKHYVIQCRVPIFFSSWIRAKFTWCKLSRYRKDSSKHKKNSSGWGDLFSLFIYIHVSLCKFQRLYKAIIQPPFWANLCVNTVYFTWSLAPVTDGNCSITSTWVVNYGKLSYLFLFVTAG